MASKKSVVCGAGLDEEKYENKAHLCFFGKGISVDIYYAILENMSLGGSDGIVKRSSMQLALLMLS